MGKSQFPSTFNWQTVNPSVGFLPGPGPNQSTAGNSPPSGIITGIFTGVETIYSNILGIRQTDNQGLEITFTGTPIGTFQVMVSNSGINFYPLTFDPPITQPTGTSLGYVIALTGIPFQYMYLIYSNTAGTGTLTVYGQQKANNN